ncbi:MAG: amidohydrolase family protein [Alphaproteobacteria bacterium]|nr:amidohydrolase family protein [Alphaproteobacteria bacterium]MBU1515185.1 amidohydrolase family protein [Alphaproteobacteria bacterium]MBU2092315.1 amidohydrolase family protein [Alphaproteobacteria bacterium]MBU2152909.1 amidohydrolase family protein [Alphaproteobacteria bacterium]MBU2305740.1 amidohydrolase family protein [Alphaproteobacteria bacterium]
MRIDAHQHFWRPARGDYGWLDRAPSAIVRDAMPEELEPLLTAAGVQRTILVQAAPSEAETAFLLSLAALTPFVAGVVGWIDFDAPDAVRRVQAAATTPLLRGLRPMVQDIDDTSWLARSDLDPVFEAMAEAGLRFDALVQPRHLAALRERLRRHPGLRVVIDHGAKPNIARGDISAWRDDLRAIAAETSACCKLSGLATEAAPGWADADLAPYVDVLAATFGAHRLMWGSDWPVLNLNGDYLGWSEAADRLLADLSPEDLAWVRGGTAAEFYGVVA